MAPLEMNAVTCWGKNTIGPRGQFVFKKPREATFLHHRPKCSEHAKDTHHLFIDFKAAYGSTDRRPLYAAMEELNIPQKLIALVKAALNNTQCRVRIQNRFSEPVNVKNGVRQRGALICLLFTITLEKVIRDAAVNMRYHFF
jgi:hypothetical protein